MTACGDSSSPTTPTATPVDPTTTEVFSGTLAVSGSRFYSFTVHVYGNVTVTLESLNESSEATDVTITVGLGLPRGIDCVASASATVSAGSDPHLRNTLDPGIYCVRVSDGGVLSAPAPFRVRIAHP